LSAVAHINDYKTGKFYRDEFRGDISWNGYEHNVLLRNEGPAPDGTLQFTDVAMATGADDIRDARGTATADFDNDGDLDVVITTIPATPAAPNSRERRCCATTWVNVATGSLSSYAGLKAIVTRSEPP
jgi:hypothetical protein